MSEQISRANQPVHHPVCSSSLRKILGHQRTRIQPLVPLIGAYQPQVPDFKRTNVSLEQENVFTQKLMPRSVMSTS